MYVEIQVSYEFFGPQTDIIFAGPFEDVVKAANWSEEFNIFAPWRKIKMTSQVISGSPTNRIVKPASKTPREVISTIIQSMTEVCQSI